MAHKFKVGDRVVCVANTLKNKWDVDIVGAAGEVLDTADNPERYGVMFDGESMVRCMYPHELKLGKPKLKVGDLVRVAGKDASFYCSFGTIIRELPGAKYMLDFCDTEPYAAEDLEYVPKKFKVGDIVQVYHGTGREVGEVEKIVPSFLWGYKYYVNGSYHAGYNMIKAENVEAVEPPEETFEVGDIVRIVRDEWYSNKNLGKIGRVVKVSKTASVTCYHLNFGDGCWFADELKLVRRI